MSESLDWLFLIEVSLAGHNVTYARLGLLINDEHLAGESIYNADLASVAAELKDRGVAVMDAGALCVFVPGFNAPMIIRKRDGGFGYDVLFVADERPGLTTAELSREDKDAISHRGRALRELGPLLAARLGAAGERA